MLSGQAGILCVLFFIMIPFLFLVFYFSVSDKSSNQMMVFPRIFIDLATGLYLIYSSLFRYYDFDALDRIYHASDGKSRLEGFNVFFSECGFPDTFRNNLMYRYFSYLFLPMLLYSGVLIQVGFVYLLYRNRPYQEPEPGEGPAAGGGGQDGDDDRYDEQPKGGCCAKLAASMPDINGPRGARFAWSTPGNATQWKEFKDHATQVWTLW
eukprot:SAG22_NODE_853_length_6848_cov_6.656394_7_plen_209_part_00